MENRQMLLHKIRVESIVCIEADNEITGGFTDRAVSRFCDPKLSLITNDLDSPRIALNDGPRIIGGVVIDHDHFAFDSLSQGTFNCLANPIAVVMAWNNDRNFFFQCY